MYSIVTRLVKRCLASYSYPIFFDYLGKYLLAIITDSYCIAILIVFMLVLQTKVTATLHASTQILPSSLQEIVQVDAYQSLINSSLLSLNRSTMVTLTT